MQILNSPFNWKNVSFHTCLSNIWSWKGFWWDNEIFWETSWQNWGRGGKQPTLHTEMLWNISEKTLFLSAISAGLIWGSSPPMESRNTPGRWKAHHGKGGEVDSLGQDTAPTQRATPSKPDSAPAPAESCPNPLPEIQNTRPLPETSVKQTPYFLSASSSLLPKSIL